MKVEELLPIGSVVLLNGGQKKLMICGIMQTQVDESGAPGESYDYIGVWYPEGQFNEVKYLFNHSDINEVFFRGYEDEERAKFITSLRSFYEK